MKVRISDIRAAGPAGLPVKFEPGPVWYAQALAGVHADTSGGSIGGEMMLLQGEENIAVSGAVSARLTMPCVRCLADVAQEHALEMALLLLPAPKRDAAGAQAVADDEDVSWVAGEAIDVGELVREKLLLALPMYPLCRPDCLGLCQRCGADLNQGPCGCAAVVEADSPFSALKGIAVARGGTK